MNIYEYFNYYMQESLEVIYYYIKVFFNIEFVSLFVKECCNMEEFVEYIEGFKEVIGLGKYFYNFDYGLYLNQFLVGKGCFCNKYSKYLDYG